MWVAHVDVATGNFVPTSGKETLVDTNAVTAQAIGNGSEWVALPAASALAYTRNSDVAGSSAADRCIGIAQVDTDGVWSGGCMPGSEGYSLPLGTTNVGDPYPMVNFQNKSQGGTNVFWQGAVLGNGPV